jgi:hypothetical protein
VDETELFRANDDLRTVGVAATTTTVAHPAVAVPKTLCTHVANSPIVRTLLLLVVIALLLFLIERMSGGKVDGDEGTNTLREMLRSVLKAGVQQAAAMPVLDGRNATTQQ